MPDWDALWFELSGYFHVLVSGNNPNHLLLMALNGSLLVLIAALIRKKRKKRVSVEVAAND